MTGRGARRRLELAPQLLRELPRDDAGKRLGAAATPMRPPRRQWRVLESRLRVAVLDPEPLDRLRRRLSRLRKLFAHPLAERCGESVDLTDRRWNHSSMEAGSFVRVCADFSTGARGGTHGATCVRRWDVHRGHVRAGPR